MSQEPVSSNQLQTHAGISDQEQESNEIETKLPPSGRGEATRRAFPQGRLSSLDALRGFDLFWITGGTAILMGLGSVIQRPFFFTFLGQFHHSVWQGLHLYDLIWPLFFFIMGVAIPLSIASRRAKGATDRSLLLHAIRRALILFFLGTITQGNLLLFDLSKFHPCYSVLHGLAAGYLIAVVVALKVKPSRHIAVIAGFLLAYWALVMLIPVPGYGAGALTPQGNAATYIDHLVLGRFEFGANTWFLSYLGFASSVLLGVLAGQLLMSNLVPEKKLSRLLTMGEPGHRATLESLVSRHQADVDRFICFDLWRHKLRGDGAVLLDHRCTRLSKLVFPVRGDRHEFVGGLLCYRGFRFQVSR
jgi:hypothetical protein